MLMQILADPGMTKGYCIICRQITIHIYRLDLGKCLNNDGRHCKNPLI